MMSSENKSPAVIDSEEKVKLTFGEKGDPHERHPPAKVSLRTKLKDREYRQKCLRTLWFGASFWALGFVFSQRGPAFLDLQIITQTDVEAASYFFTSSSVGYLVGSFVAGLVYSMFNKSLLLLLCLFGMAMTTVAVPWCSIYALMIAIHFVFSLFGVGNTEMVRVWGKEGEGAMQFVHFAYAFGGVIAPLVTEPFLTPVPEDNNMTTTIQYINSTANPLVSVPYTASQSVSINRTTSSFLASDIGRSTLLTEQLTSTFSHVADAWNATMTTLNVTDPVTAAPLPLTTRVHYAYLIAGSIILLIMVPVTVQMFTDRSQKRRQTAEDEKKDLKQPLPLGLFLLVLSALCLFNFLNVSVEDTFVSYLSAFVVKQLHWSKSAGARVTSLFWAMFASCRFVSIFTIHFLSSARLLLWCCLAWVASMLVFLVCSYHNVSAGVWASSALVGASMAAIFPTGFSWMEEELVRVTGVVASCVVISASMGSMSSPVLLGFLMQQKTPMWFSFLMFGEAAACLLVFLFLLALSRLYLRKRYTMSPPDQHQEVAVSAWQEDSRAGEESTV
ncbi:sodium-dependent glucose transporter 1A-like [Babylonia areolata]|uniref:sodium-dependent glucose transporter 1A-like n=1 Tax=Babylonia areolata TaxID=304850 RepID=UPI003FD4EE11